MKMKKKMYSKNYIALAVLLVVFGCIISPNILDAVNAHEIYYVSGQVERIMIRSGSHSEIDFFVDKQRYYCPQRSLSLHEEFSSLGLSVYEVLNSIVENKEIITVGYLNNGFHRRVVSIGKDGIHYFDDRALYWDCVNSLYLCATISLVCLLIGIRMLIRYKHIYKKKQQ